MGVYVALEAFHKQDMFFFINSPEWAIATIFLSFQGVSLYRQGLKKLGSSLSDVSFEILTLFYVVITIVATVNAYKALSENTDLSVFVRLVLFFIASICFLLLVSSAKLAQSRTE